MSIVACPRCRDEVTLPAKVSPQARVRCPLCRDEYILSEALAKMPPALIVLDAGPDADVSDYAEPEYKVAGAAMGGMFDASPAVGESPVMPAPRGTATRPKKKSSGAVSQIVQVVLGGIGAFAIFVPIAWWVPQIDQDIFGVGPIVGKYVPAIVPAKFRGTESDNSKTGEDKLAKNQNDVKKFPKPEPKKTKNNKKTNKANGFDPGEQFQLDPNSVNPNTPSLDPLDPGTPPPVTPEPEVKIDDPLAPPPEKPIDFTPPMPKPVDPNAKSPVSTQEVTTAYAFAVQKREDFEASAGEEAAVRRQKGKDLYDAAAELGKLCAEADMTEGENLDKISLITEHVTTKIANYGPMLALFADQRLADGAKEAGIAVKGTIKDLKPLGATHEMTIEVTRPDKTLFTIPIVTTKSLEDEGAKIGDSAIVLGKIIRDPKKDLPKYKGEAPQVIQAGHTMLIPTP